ncbi:MAG TPA: D-alanyl-D-alanine endopeptidase [Candidatus Binatia bacterium]|nr:D-alanyl-D-alanine endopeptidase [Candidatus Binatia bacterium]
MGVRGAFGRRLAGCVFLGLALAAAQAPAQAAASSAERAALRLKSDAVLVVDQDSGETLAAKNADAVRPIASLTKLMTALVLLEARQPPGQMLQITADDTYPEKPVFSRLKVGTVLPRHEMLLLALMASENRAALALSREYPGGRAAFIARMNAKARELGMNATHFDDPAGLSSRSVSTARDLQRLITAASADPTIREYSTRTSYTVRVQRRLVRFINSNRLVRASGHWDIELQKTGFTNEAGRCLVMLTNIANRRVAMVFLNSFGKLSRYGDASRVRQRVETELRKRLEPVAARS